ncbi:hypothetical protein PEC302110_13560 [Pectobacterium araliae]|uniref:Uncharacterized protein n=1 Tax=Pectobacterium araliae TaxID=3073862 RepID=A0AAN0KLL3_9GAMM|nr:hypothetical protein PEC302110_13560 [Pectobacterium sp. MAFF 302110]
MEFFCKSDRGNVKKYHINTAVSRFLVNGKNKWHGFCFIFVVDLSINFAVFAIKKLYLPYGLEK